MGCWCAACFVIELEFYPEMFILTNPSPDSEGGGKRILLLYKKNIDELKVILLGKEGGIGQNILL